MVLLFIVLSFFTFLSTAIFASQHTIPTVQADIKSNIPLKKGATEINVLSLALNTTKSVIEKYKQLNSFNDIAKIQQIMMANCDSRSIAYDKDNPWIKIIKSTRNLSQIIYENSEHQIVYDLQNPALIELYEEMNNFFFQAHQLLYFVHLFALKSFNTPAILSPNQHSLTQIAPQIYGRILGHMEEIVQTLSISNMYTSNPEQQQLIVLLRLGHKGVIELSDQINYTRYRKQWAEVNTASAPSSASVAAGSAPSHAAKK